MSKLVGGWEDGYTQPRADQAGDRQMGARSKGCPAVGPIAGVWIFGCRECLRP